MEEKENKRISLIVDDEPGGDNSSLTESKSKVDKLKKPLIFGLMGIVFIACLYLIFKPKSSGSAIDEKGLKNVVPEATDKGLQADKQKAYEKEMLDEKEAEKRSSLQSLADYWNNSGDSTTAEFPGSTASVGNTSGNIGNPGYQYNSLTSYRNAQSTLSSFYQDDDREKLELRRKVDQLQEKLSAKDVPAAPTLNDQLTLMEKSYQMASKYLPSGTQRTDMTATATFKDSANYKNPKSPSKTEKTESLKGLRKSIVSALYREQDDSTFLASLEGERNHSFLTVGAREKMGIARNSIRAIIMETKTVTADGSVKLRLLEDAAIAGYSVPKGTELEAGTKFQGNRLRLKVSSVEVEGNILPVEILAYDLNGQLGLSVPRSDEINAAGEIAANMSQSSGMNISMSRSAGQQVVGDLTRGLLQGVSGYFSKKIRAVKVVLKAGQQVLLVPKKNN
ncbi:conjugative transposon protein TraM [Sphingobacterium siyangense]|uniref:Conjugative transposon protein TraM n=1 Tax=Sphingobacterium siyangense TaxID=459529 RepID=A0A420FW01_9SPHI|nr:conjugative transposon protein TraM [Sphingobacterium siyangense]RKF37120.1 conjugative transposon protein TraM [Sphingobacterium siyangense]